MFSNLTSTRFQPLRYRPGSGADWSGHLPFAADLIEATNPSSLVELGTQYGESYFGFCQAIQECGLGCQAHAVGAWEEDSLEEVTAYNAAHYRSFSALLGMSSDQAATRFADGTVDLLHLDGRHTYPAVKHDFETWLPKVSQHGIILIDHIAVRQGDSGTWRLWEEIATCFPSFAFHHSCGLGVIAKAGAGQSQNRLLAALFAGECDPQAIRDYYVLCAERLCYAHRTDVRRVPTCQMFSPGSSGYSDDRRGVMALQAGKWVRIEFDVPAPHGRLRLDPSNCKSLIEISELVVECPAEGRVLWRLDPARTGEIACAGTAVRMPDDRSLIVLSYGDDPQLFLPSLEATNSALHVYGWIRVRPDPDFHLTGELLEKYAVVPSQVATIQRSLDEALAASALLLSERDTYARLQQQAETELVQIRADCGVQSAVQAKHVQQLESELTLLRAKNHACAQLRQQSQAEVMRLRGELETLSERLGKAEVEALAIANHRRQIESGLDRLHAEARQTKLELEALRTSRDAALSQHLAIRKSLSWRITAPLRRLGLLFISQR